MLMDEPGKSHDRLTSADTAEHSTIQSSDPTHDALQSFAHIIQEKAVSAPAPDASTGSAAETRGQIERGPMSRSSGGESVVRRAQHFLQQQPWFGIAVGAVVGFVFGRLRK